MKSPIFVVALLSVLLPGSIAANCCPPQRNASDDQFLQLQQSFGEIVMCTYGLGPNFKQCLYGIPSGNRLTANNSCADTTAQDTFAAPFCPPTSVLHPNHDPNKCIEVKGANYADGTPIQVNQCNGQNNQRFIFNFDYTVYPDTLIRVAGTDFCVAGGNVVGSAVILKKCDKTSSDQIWVYESLNHRVSLYTWSRPSHSLLLSLPNAQNGQQLDMQVFDHLDRKQSFYLDSREN